MADVWIAELQPKPSILKWLEITPTVRQHAVFTEPEELGSYVAHIAAMYPDWLPELRLSMDPHAPEEST